MDTDNRKSPYTCNRIKTRSRLTGVTVIDKDGTTLAMCANSAGWMVIDLMDEESNTVSFRLNAPESLELLATMARIMQGEDA